MNTFLYLYVSGLFMNYLNFTFFIDLRADTISNSDSFKFCSSARYPNILLKFCSSARYPNILLKFCKVSKHTAQVLQGNQTYCSSSARYPNILLKFCKVSKHTAQVLQGIQTYCSRSARYPNILLATSVLVKGWLKKRSTT